MADQASTIEDYLSTGKPSWGWHGQDEAKSELARKSFAQQLARTATRSIDDRHRRAEVKVAVYNHLTPLLEQHHRALTNLHRFYRKLLLITGGALAAAVALIFALITL